MNDLPELCFTMETYFFSMREEEIGEITAKMKDFLQIVEMIKPSRFINSTLRWCGLERQLKDWEKMLRAFFLKSVYGLPTTKGLIGNLKTIRVCAGFAVGNGEVPLATILSSASLHDSHAAIPLMQMSSEQANGFCL